MWLCTCTTLLFTPLSISFEQINTVIRTGKSPSALFSVRDITLLFTPLSISFEQNNTVIHTGKSPSALFSVRDITLLFTASSSSFEQNNTVILNRRGLWRLHCTENWASRWESISRMRSYWNLGITIFPPPFFPEKIYDVPFRNLSLFFNFILFIYLFFCIFLFLDLSLNFKNQGKSAGNVTKYDSSFVLRKSKSRWRKSYSFSSPKYQRELCISESATSSCRWTQSSDSVRALTSHGARPAGTKTKKKKTRTDVRIEKMQLK